MLAATLSICDQSSFPIMLTTLPGPDRKRSRKPYYYRLIYRHPEPDGVGCALLWEVLGGRLPYQLALERDADGNLRLHCTCADAIYRAEEEGRFCKHAHGLLESGLRHAVRIEPRLAHPGCELVSA
jgi:hypothetical protein